MESAPPSEAVFESNVVFESTTVASPLAATAPPRPVAELAEKRQPLAFTRDRKQPRTPGTHAACSAGPPSAKRAPPSLREPRA